MMGEIKKHKLYSILMVISIWTGILMLITFDYEDLDSITAWSLNFWDLLKKGKLNEFYQYAGENIRGAAHANCAGNWLWLLPICLWNFPLWIVQNGTVSIHHFGSLCWTKLFLWLLCFVTANFVRKIYIMLTNDKSKGMLAFLLIMASPEILMSVGYAGQDEIVYVCQFTLALYYFLKNEWRKCYLLMVVCITICPIMLLPCICLILIKEKNLAKICSYVVGAGIPLVTFEVLYRHDTLYQTVKAKNDFVELAYNMLSSLKTDIGTSVVSVSGVLLIGVYFAAYKIKNEKNFGKESVFLVAIIFAIINFTMANYFYRAFLYVPFVILLVLISEQKLEMNMFLLTILTYGRTFQACIVNAPQNMNTFYIMKNSWLTCLCDLFGSKRYLRHERICLTMSNELLQLSVNTCTLALMIILIYINHPSNKGEYPIKCDTRVSLIVYSGCMPVLMLMFYVVLLF